MYDRRTAQVFEERIVYIQRLNDDRNWHQKTPTTLCQKYMSSGTIAYSNYCKMVERNRCLRIIKGSRKLLHISISVLMSNLQFLPPSTLKRIPQHLFDEVARSIQERFTELGPLGCIPLDILEVLPLSAVENLWTAINQRAQLNLDTWKRISKRLLSEKYTDVKDLGLRRYRQVIESPNSDLSFYTAPITSTSFEFLTSLSIAIWAPMRDLVKLADVINLGILQIYETESSLDHRFERIVPDKLLRAWAKLAVEKSAFSVLRVLKFDVLGGGLTDGSLRHFNSFPALGLIYPGRHGMSEGVYDKGRELGWQAMPLVSGPMVPNRDLFSLYNNLGVPGNENLFSFPCSRQAWYTSTGNSVGRNPTMWDGCEVAALPSETGHKFLTALNLIEPPTHRFSGAKLDEDRYKLDFDYSSFILGETWRKTDWDLFCESIQCERTITGHYWDWRCLEGFYSLSYLRHDSDLRNAGVKECGMGIASVGRAFKSVISTTPMVSILLGKRNPNTERIRDYYLRPQYFLRVKVPDSVSNVSQPASNPAEPKPSAAPATSNKRPRSASQRTRRIPKVQKFEDFFGVL